MLEISTVYIALREMTRRNSSNDFANGRAHSKGRANRQRGAGEGRQEEGMKGATRRIRTISYNHPCLLSFSSIFLSLSPRQSGSWYFSGPHAFLYLTIVGQRSTSRAGNGLLTNPWRLLYAWSDGRPLIFKDIADTLPLSRLNVRLKITCSYIDCWPRQLFHFYNWILYCFYFVYY